MRSCRLGEVANVQSGFAFKSSEFKPKGIKLLRNTNILPQRIYWDDLACLDFSQYERYSTYQLQPGDLLLSLDRPIISSGIKVARVGESDVPSLLVQRVGRIRFDESQVDADYLYAFLQSPRFITEVSGHEKSIGVPHVSPSQVEAVALLLPELDEQRQIAARLKAQLAEVDTARQAALVQLNDTRLLRARMLKAFFAELDAGPKKRLGDHAETTSGSTPSRSNKAYWQPAEIAWVKTGEVAFAPITATEEAISRTALAECSLSLLPPKTVLVAMYGQGKTRGQSAMLEIPATTNQACFAILPNTTWEPDFLHLWLKASYQDLRDLSEDRGGNQANLNGALLKALEIPAPSPAEQQRTVARIQAAMVEIDAMENAAKSSLDSINLLPGRVLAHAFQTQGD